MSDFKWNTDDAESVVLQHQPRTAVYSSRTGNVIVRQEGEYGEDDQLIYLTPMGALAIGWDLIRIAHEVGMPAPPPEARKAINLGPAGPAVQKSPPSAPGALLAVMEAANAQAAE